MTRRTAFAFFTAFRPMVAADPWKGGKPAGEWSESDIRKLFTRSPWAKEVTVPMGGPGMGGMGGGGRRGGGMGGPGGGGMGGPGGGMDAGGGTGGIGGGGMGGPGGLGGPGGGMGGPGGMSGMPEAKALVRWESAQPLYDGSRRARPDQANSYYVVSVSGMPMPGGRGPGGPRGEGKGDPGGMTPEERRKAMMDRLKQSASLERKGKDPIAPDAVETVQTGNGGPMLVFLFPRAPQPIAIEDKDVTFHARMGPMEIKAKFALKEMIYNGKLAL
jgi:hypothetical protein